LTTSNSTDQPDGKSPLAGPEIVPEFEAALTRLCAAARRGQRTDSELYNPSEEWLVDNMSIFQDLPGDRQSELREEALELEKVAAEVNSAGRAATKVWPETVFRLDNGGLAFFSQLGVVRRPDLTQYFVEGFTRNRDALAFTEDNQRLFTQVFDRVTEKMEADFASGQGIVHTDRQICDAPGRSYHARQLLFGTRYLQAPYMWRRLTFDLPQEQWQESPDILEVSVPRWMDDLELDDALKSKLQEQGITQLVFKAPTRGLSLHFGFDYVGEHKMGPLSIAMHQVKEKNGLAVQAALSMARVRNLDGETANTALITVGPSLHGKSTLTIMVELANSELAGILNLPNDPDEGVYPMNDDIVLLQPLDTPVTSARGGRRALISHAIDGTENNFYAVPFGLTREDDPITFDTLRGAPGITTADETLENVPVHVDSQEPNYMENPVRNMRMILSRRGLLARKGARDLISTMTGGKLTDSVHVPMENTDRVFWQEVMRQNTVIPPLRRLSLEQYIRVLMYGEAVQMGAAIGAIGRPYVEYFSDPFIIGLEDENANLLYHVLQQLAWGGMPQEYYAFNTGGVGADTNDEAAGSRYLKIPRELTMMLQEALLRDAVKFEYDSALRSEVAVAIMGHDGNEVVDLREKWLPVNIYGEANYTERMVELMRRRYYGRDQQDKAGILRYTKVVNTILDITDIPAPTDERELSWILSFYWSLDQAYGTLAEVARHRNQGMRPVEYQLRELQRKYRDGVGMGLSLSADAGQHLATLGLRAG
jgi:ATP-dependent phosphoenolpyruvate carboxykinase